MKNRCWNLKWIRVPFIWIVVSFIFLYATTLFAGQVTLGWDTSDNPSLDGYRLFMRTQSQAYDYASPVWSGTETTCTINNLADDTYYFVARAYAGNNESIDSNEVEYKVVVNSAPVSVAGADQAVSEGAQVTLDGSGSSDSDGLISKYQWTQTSGPSVSLSSFTSNLTTFTAPSVTESTALSFQLSVTDDGGLTNSDTCQITVLPVAPTDSDDDGLTDAEETDIYGTDPYNSDSDGDGVSDGQEISMGTDPLLDNSQTGNTKIWIESEDADINFPFEIAEDPNASAGSYAWIPNGVGNYYNKAGGIGYLSFTFEVQKSGNYVVWGRILSPTAADDSFYLSIDDGENMVWHTYRTLDQGWAWDPVSVRKPNDDRNSNKPLLFYLEAGKHTLMLKHREDGTKIDRIMITNDMEYTPEGVGEASQPETPMIWVEAEEANINFPFEIADEPLSSAGQYVWIPNGVGSYYTNAAGSGYLELTFDVQETGDYVVWGRVLSPSSADDSFYLSVDDSADMVWHTYRTLDQGWTWDLVSVRLPSDIRDASDPLLFHLESGTHTLTLKHREDGTKIDRFLITSDLDITPSGLGN